MRTASCGRNVTSQMPFAAASVICPELSYATYSTGTASCAAISLPRSTGTPAYPPASFLVDQNAPPAVLIAIATRSLPVGAISSLRASALAGTAIMIETPRTRLAMRGKDGQDIGYSPRRVFARSYVTQFIQGNNASSARRFPDPEKRPWPRLQA